MKYTIATCISIILALIIVSGIHSTKYEYLCEEYTEPTDYVVIEVAEPPEPVVTEPTATVEPMIIEEKIVEVEEVIEDADTDPHFDNEYDDMIYQATKDTIVDPYMAMAISRLETGNYTSNAFVNGHNFGGMTGSNGVMSFSSLQDGLDRYISMLTWYCEKGMDTPQKMQSVYCPPNDKWDDIVSSIYNELIDGTHN